MKPFFALAVATLSCAVNSPAFSDPLRNRTSAYEVELLVDGRAVSTYWHEGETFALGQLGERYTIRVHNRSGRRIEAVVSVDGRDVIDGRPGDFENKRGYLVPAWGSVDIEGWRTSAVEAAAFRFSSVADSYAAQTGTARNVGVIGVAIFPERVVPPPPPVYEQPTYRDQWNEDKSEEGYGGLGRSEHGRAAEPAPAPRTFGSTTTPDDLPRHADAMRHKRPGLGTEYGEARYAPIRQVEFVRARPSRPTAVLGLRYNDRQGLLALGIDVDRHPHYYSDEDLRATANPFPRSWAPPPSGWRR